MSILATRYGVARPRAITTMLQRLQIALPSVPVIETTPAAPSATEIKANWVAAQQAERAQLRADIAFMTHYAANYDDGPTADEIAALEQRLDDLNDFLILEDDAQNVLPLAA